MNYKKWLDKYNLEDNEQNLYLYEHKGDMGFIFQEFRDACEEGRITIIQKIAVLGMEVLQVTDLYDSYYWAFYNMQDLERAIEVINAYEELYDYSDMYGGFYGQVEQIFKMVNIKFLTLEDINEEEIGEKTEYELAF